MAVSRANGACGRPWAEIGCGIGGRGGRGGWGACRTLEGERGAHSASISGGGAPPVRSGREP